MSKLRFIFPLLIWLLAGCTAGGASQTAVPGTSTRAAPTAAATTTDLGVTPSGTIPNVAAARGTEVSGPEAAPSLLTDGLGRAVRLNAPAQHVVSLAPSNTEILFALGAGPDVVGRDEFSDYPPEAKSLPSVGGSMGQYSYEQITALKPDLVLAAELNTPEQVKALEDLGLRVYYLSNPDDLDGLYANLRTVGLLTGKTSAAERLVASLQKRVQAVQERIAPLSTCPKVYYELDGSDPSKPFTSGSGTFVDRLLGLAGGCNIGDDLGKGWVQVSAEAVLVRNPDVILLGDSIYGVTPGSLAARPGWSQLAAVKDGKVYPFDDNLVSRPTPRLIDGLEALARLLHPEP